MSGHLQELGVHKIIPKWILKKDELFVCVYWVYWRAVVNMEIYYGFHKTRTKFDRLSHCQFVKRVSSTEFPADP
jgi:hypothetical protein